MKRQPRTAQAELDLFPPAQPELFPIVTLSHPDHAATQARVISNLLRRRPAGWKKTTR